MHAGARPIGERLGHECRFHAMLHGNALHQPLVHHGIVSSAQGIRLVPQREFELTRRIFRNAGFQRKPLRIARRIEIVEERLEVLHLTQSVDLYVATAVARYRSARSIWSWS